MIGSPRWPPRAWIAHESGKRRDHLEFVTIRRKRGPNDALVNRSSIVHKRDARSVVEIVISRCGVVEHDPLRVGIVRTGQHVDDALLLLRFEAPAVLSLSLRPRG